MADTLLTPNPIPADAILTSGHIAESSRDHLAGWLKSITLADGKSTAYTGHGKDKIADLRTHATAVALALTVMGAQADQDDAPAAAPEADVTDGLVKPKSKRARKSKRAAATTPPAQDTPAEDTPEPAADLPTDPVALVAMMLVEAKAAKAAGRPRTDADVATAALLALPKPVRDAAVRTYRKNPHPKDAGILAAHNGAAATGTDPAAAVKRPGARKPHARSTSLTMFRVAGFIPDPGDGVPTVDQDDMVTCTGACGLDLPVTRYPTVTAGKTGQGYRLDECRSCRGIRMASLQAEKFGTDDAADVA
jgi:hypothetical protein